MWKKLLARVIFLPRKGECRKTVSLVISDGKQPEIMNWNALIHTAMGGMEDIFRLETTQTNSVKISRVAISKNIALVGQQFRSCQKSMAISLGKIL